MLTWRKFQIYKVFTESKVTSDPDSYQSQDPDPDPRENDTDPKHC